MILSNLRETEEQIHTFTFFCQPLNLGVGRKKGGSYYTGFGFSQSLFISISLNNKSLPLYLI
jgi:hypothetical protein